MGFRAKAILTRRQILIGWVRQHCQAALGTETERAATKGCAAQSRAQGSEMAWPTLRRAVENTEVCKAAGSPTPTWPTNFPRRKPPAAHIPQPRLTLSTNAARHSP